MMKKFILLYILFSSHAFALKEIYLSKVHDGGKEWSIFLDKNSGLDKVVFKEKAGVTSSFETDSVAHNFVKVAPITFSKNSKLYFVTIWSKGAHGQTIRVIDPTLKENNVVFSYNSAWPLTYTFEKGELVVKGAGDMNEDTGEPIEQIVKFKP